MEEFLLVVCAFEQLLISINGCNVVKSNTGEFLTFLAILCKSLDPRLIYVISLFLFVAARGCKAMFYSKFPIGRTQSHTHRNKILGQFIYKGTTPWCPIGATLSVDLPL